MATLSICLMGGISIINGNQRLDNKLSHKAIFILSLLIISEKKQMNKSRLSSMLWPDSDDEASKYNLRYNIWNIKKLIPSVNSVDFIITDKNDIFINPEFEYESDIEIIKDYRKDIQHTKEELNKIKKLFKGDFLEGMVLKGSPEILDLILMERIYCQNIKINILKELYEKHKEENNHDACIYNLLELQRIDPFNEVTAYKIMNHLNKQGQYAKSIAYYKDFSSNLRHDLNISPCDELRELYEKILERSDSTQTVSPRIPDKTEAIRLETFCVEGVDYFWMSECINQIIKNTDNNIFDRIDDNILAHLAYISPGIYKYCVSEKDKTANYEVVLPIQIINSFYEFLAIVAESVSLTINIYDFELMDSPSKSAIILIEKRPIASLEFIYN